MYSEAFTQDTSEHFYTEPELPFRGVRYAHYTERVRSAVPTTNSEAKEALPLHNKCVAQKVDPLLIQSDSNAALVSYIWFY